MIEAQITRWPNLISTRGVVETLPWGRLFNEFSHWREFAGDREHPGWSAAVFDPPERAQANVRSVTALVLDYDSGTPIDDVFRSWEGRYGLLHTTRKHTPSAPRCRVVLPFDRAVTPAEYSQLWTLLAPPGVDQAPKDPSRFWFAPGSPNEHTFEAHWLAGDMLSVGDLLKLVKPAPAPVRRPIEPRSASAYERAAAYIAKMPEAISGSGGHGALWAAALVAVQGFQLSESDAMTLLITEYNPRCSPPWREKEILHKVQDAANSTKVPQGYKINEQRDWHRTIASSPRRDPEADRGDAWEPPADDAAAPPEDAPVDPVQKFGIKSIAELLASVYQRASTEKPAFGCPSGVDLIDRQLGGFRRGMVTVLGAPTSWGKSSFAIMTTDACFSAGKRVLLISAEDSDSTYGDRFMARRSGVSARMIRDNTVRPNDFSAMLEQVERAEKEPIFVKAIGLPVEDIAECIRLMCQTRDTDLVIVDYLQAISCRRKQSDRRGEINYIARTTVDAIKNAGSSGLVFSQLKRLDDNAVPDMHDLKESGDLENMAEHVLIGSIAKDTGPTCDVWHRRISVEKNKDGPRYPKPFELAFDEITANFTGGVI